MYEISRDIERILVGKEELNGICDRLAAQITAEYGDSPRDLVMVVVLKGSVMFATDLVRRIPRHVCLEFMKVSSYGAETESSGLHSGTSGPEAGCQGRGCDHYRGHCGQRAHA